MIRIILIIAIILTIKTTTTTSTGMARIPLPTPPLPNESEIAIVVLQKPQSEREIREFLSRYKGIKLRRVFQEALFGFSIEADSAAITQLEQEQKQVITTISPIIHYQAQSEEGVKIIGGEEVRRFFDPKNKRLTGKGVTVGVIDTGVDYTHPDLRRNFGGGQDLVDNDKDPMETLAIGKATLHGTHVAGIIAANGKIQGVAPEAKIIAYRALGPGGGGTTEQVLAAIEQAIKDHVDIVNLSLGNDINGPDLPLSMALNKAVDKGITAVVANGNSGPSQWTVGSPGTASKAISVGASTPTLEIPTISVEGVREPFRIQSFEGSAKWATDRPLELVDGGIGRKADLKNVQGKMVLIQRGRITFTEKAKNAMEAGARAVLIYNNTSGNFMGNLETGLTLPVGSLAKRDGDFLKRKITTGLIARLSIIEERDRLADFSSRGPVTGTWEIKPDIVAPGVAVNSTVPGGYLSLQGTSMAAPHVAGACALIKQAHPDWAPVKIKAALMNTAQSLSKNYRTFEQGAGRIQVDAAVKARSLVMPSSIRFGEYSGGNKPHQAHLQVENTSGQALRYAFEVPQAAVGLSWRMPLPFTLGPNQKKDVTIELEVEPEQLKGKLHDGYLKLSAGGNAIQIPYLYVLDEPNYPRVMGFEFGAADKPGFFRYEVYLPGGADEFGIALFNPEDYRFIGFLDAGRNLKKGQIHKELTLEHLPAEGTYLAKVFAKKAGKEDSIETIITLEKSSK